LGTTTPTLGPRPSKNLGPTGRGFWGSRSFHPSGVNSLFSNGSLHSVKNTINPFTWFAIGTKDPDEVVIADMD